MVHNRIQFEISNYIFSSIILYQYIASLVKNIVHYDSFIHSLINFLPFSLTLNLVFGYFCGCLSLSITVDHLSTKRIVFCIYVVMTMFNVHIVSICWACRCLQMCNELISTSSANLFTSFKIDRLL